MQLAAKSTRPKADDHRELALRTILAKSFRRGSIRLSSGKISEYYIDMKPTMLYPAGSLALANLIFDRIGRMDVDLVGGLELGAVPLVCNLTMLSAQRGRPIPGFFVRKVPKEHGTQRQIEANDPKGKRIVILDDVTTSGASAMKAVDAAREAGGIVQLVLSVVDRQEGAREFYGKLGLPFDSIFTRDELMIASGAASTPSTSG